MRPALGVLLLVTQTTASFDVVAIKPGQESASPSRGTRLQNNRWTASRATLREMIKEAYKSAGFDMPDRVVHRRDRLVTGDFGRPQRFCPKRRSALYLA